MVYNVFIFSEDGILGNKVFGRNYCAQFACNTLASGGATLKTYNMEELMNEAASIIEEHGLLGLRGALKVVQSGPAGENIVNDIKNTYE